MSGKGGMGLSSHKDFTHADSHVDGYVEQAKKEQLPKLRGEDVLVHRPPQTLPRAVERISRAANVDELMDNLYAITLHQSALLAERVRVEKEALNPSEMAQLAKLVEATNRLTRLQMEREKHEELGALDEEELRQMLEAAQRKLEG